MMSDAASNLPSNIRVAAESLEKFCREAIRTAGADRPTADAATRAMMHASRLGIDSHGVRMLAHYRRAISKGRVNGRPELRFTREFGSTALLDADNAHGALATYAAMKRAIAIADRAGLGAVAIQNSSHLGAAGAYPLVAAEAGMIGFCVCNADAIVRLHGGAEKFHGTNPIAAAVPVPGERPWLLDVPTSAMPLQRVNLYKSLGKRLPPGMASDAEGKDTDDPSKVAMLVPLGGETVGYKGAGLAGLAEILSTALTGMGLSFELIGMVGDDLSTPRRLGAFVMVINPTAFVDKDVFDARILRYLAALRGSRSAAGGTVLAPGDREWAEEERRRKEGIPLDPQTVRDFADISQETGIASIVS
jgi:LDH2 family malate/lactate/ureidoglycolate dehydrogenase